MTRICTANSANYELVCLVHSCRRYASKWGDSGQEAATIRGMLSSNGSHWHSYLTSIAHVLFHYQYPKYQLMQMGLSAMGDMLPFFDGLPISMIMQQVCMPVPSCRGALAGPLTATHAAPGCA